VKSRAEHSFKSEEIRHSRTPKRGHSDDTLRGRMRRSWFKFYKKCSAVWEKLIDLAMIHCSKLALFGLFCVSVIRPNVFNAILFLIFLIFVMANYH